MTLIGGVVADLFFKLDLVKTLVPTSPLLLSFNQDMFEVYPSLRPKLILRTRQFSMPERLHQLRNLYKSALILLKPRPVLHRQPYKLIKKATDPV